MKKQPNSKQSTRLSHRFALVRLLLLLLCCYFAYHLISGEVDLMVQKQQVETLTEELSEQKAASAELERLFGSTEDIDAYYEEIARDELGYAYPDEWIFMDITGK